MRLALSFSIYADQPSVNRRMRKEDEKLKIAIGKHYKKLVIMERNKHTVGVGQSSYKFSECVIDLVAVLGFKKSTRHEDELSKESESLLGDGGDSVSEIMSESAISKYGG